MKVIDGYAVRGGVGMNECRYEYQLNLIMNKMLSTDIRTSVTCDVIRSIEADVAAEVCDNNNIHGVHYTPSDNNVYDIRPIEEELEDEQVAKRNKSMKVERNNSNLCSSQMRACMRSGGDLTLLNPLLRPMLDSLSMKLFGDKSKYQRFCEIYVELNPLGSL